MELQKIRPTYQQGSLTTVPKLFTAEECGHINTIVDKNPLKKALVDGRREDGEVRKSEVQWLKPNPETEWIFKRIFDTSMDVNNRVYGFNLHFLEDLQFLQYQKGHYFKRHIDMTGQGVTLQKLAVSIQLSDSSDYEGGNLEVIDNSGVNIAPRGIGDATFFPIYLLHEAHTITSGTRRCLIAWMCGERPFA